MFLDQADDRREARRRWIDLALDIGIPLAAAVATLAAMLIFGR
jgi:hypothetical protein